MDNTGPYTSVAKFLLESPAAGFGTKKKLVLSNKTLIAGTEYEFDFTTSGDDPEIADFLVSGDFYGVISLVSGGKLRVSDGTNIADGVAYSINTDLSEQQVLDHIYDAMAFIDRHTRQFFNRREFTADAPMKIEGMNSKTLLLPVPIIEITQIKKAPPVGDDVPLDDVTIYNSRTKPDDRNNPMIKLQKQTDDVLFVETGKFMRGVIYEIIGAFGYLEADGSTPRLIQRACLKLALKYASVSLGTLASESAASGDKGAIKREKTDMHEIEYYDPKAGSGASGGLNVGSGLSGDDEIDDIIAAYKGPVLIDGTYPDIGHEAPILASVSWRGGSRGL